LPGLASAFGIRSAKQLGRDARFTLRQWLAGRGFYFGLSSVGFARPDLSLPAYAGLVPADRLAPVYHLYDRITGGQRYAQRVTRKSARDFRGGQLSYDDHDGTDLVCPVGTPLGAAAPGVVAAVRDRWLRGGLTICVDHGHGVLTQYTHCSAALLAPGTMVARGEPVALSGVSGLDLAVGFPWVPFHVHFSVWASGKVVDPFRAPGEARRAGCWAHGNSPRPPSEQDDHEQAEARASVAPSPVDEGRLSRACSSCADAEIRAELERARAFPAGLAAIVEDALHHERYAFADPSVLGLGVRPAGLSETAAAIELGLSLPLPASDYAAIRFADTLWTAPKAGSTG